MTATLIQALSGTETFALSVLGFLVLLALGYVTIQYFRRQPSVRSSEVICNHAKLNCQCKRCLKLKEYYKTIVKLHKRLNDMHETLTVFSTKINYPNRPPAKFPIMKETVDLSQLNRYEKKVDNYHVQLEEYHKKINEYLGQL